MKKYKLADYKGKYFIIQDEIDPNDPFDYPYIIPEISEEQLTDGFLQGHVENAIYYGIPAYVGDNKELKERIEKIYEFYDSLNAKPPDDGAASVSGLK